MKNHSLSFTLGCCLLFVSSNTFSQSKEVKSSEIQNLKEENMRVELSTGNISISPNTQTHEIDSTHTLSLEGIVSTPNQVRTVNYDGSETISIGTKRSQPSIEQQLISIDDHLRAIDVKWKWVESNEELKNKAIEEKWFESMTQTKEELLKKKSHLLNESSN
jgi:hypothetical protein